MNTYVHLWQYFTYFLLEWKIFQIIVVEKIKYTFYVQQIFSEIRAVF